MGGISLGGLGSRDFPVGVAVTPDGKHLYVTNDNFNNVLVIDIATSTVVATVKVGKSPFGVAITPDGKHVFVTNQGSNSVSVIDTATNKVAATVGVGNTPEGVAITPDGRQVYVTNVGGNSVSVIDTNPYLPSVAATVTVGSGPSGVAVTPDGKHVYVTGSVVSVIDTASNTVVATVPVPGGAVGIVPPPPGVPFLAFNAKLAIDLDTAPKTDTFNLHSHFTLSSTAPGIHPPYRAGHAPGRHLHHHHPARLVHEATGRVFHLRGDDWRRKLKRADQAGGHLAMFNVSATGASLTGTKNTVYVTLAFGDDSGVTSVTADITH